MNRLSLAEAHAMIEGLTEAQKEKLLVFLEKIIRERRNCNGDNAEEKGEAENESH